MGRLKWHTTGLDASVLFCSASRRCSRKRSASLLPVDFLDVDFLSQRAGYAIDDICGGAGEMVSDFNGSIGS